MHHPIGCGKMKYRRNRFYGYTLLEMIMVMAIIAILLSMMFPVFAKAFKKARSLGDENPKDPDGPRISPSSVNPGEFDDD